MSSFVSRETRTTISSEARFDSQHRSRLLVLAYHYPPANTSAARRPAYMVKYLSRFGYSPHVIAFGDPKWRDGQPNVSYVEPLGHAKTGLTLLGRLFQKLTGRYSDRLPWVPHAYVEAADFIHERRPIAVLSTSPPIASHLT